jgi:hypothetical protein
MMEQHAKSTKKEHRSKQRNHRRNANDEAVDHIRHKPRPKCSVGERRDRMRAAPNWNGKQNACR